MTNETELPPLPVGEADVVWYEPLSGFSQPGKIIDASIAFMEASPIGTKLYTADQMQAYARDALRAAAVPVDRLQERVAFEAALRDLGIEPGARNLGDYTDRIVNRFWKLWLARSALSGGAGGEKGG